MANSRTRSIRVLAMGLAVVALGGLGSFGWSTWTSRDRSPLDSTMRRVPVQRASLNVTLRAGGQVESSEKTLIECEIENLRFSAGGGNSISTGNRSTIIEIIPDGSTVKRDDVLCRLDSSNYEEMVRQQEIKVQQSRNDFYKTQLDLKAAEIALAEYRDGILPSQEQQLDSQIVMANSDLKRQTDRLNWAGRMLKNGYISGGQFASEEQGMLRARINHKTLTGRRAVLKRFEGPIAITKLEMRVSSAKTVLAFQELRLKRTEEQLQKFQKQVELCTVKAPHDGFVIYANEEDGDARVELGAEVHQKMDLFYLPNLQVMQVDAMIHETLVDRVKEGMTVRARVESLPLYEMEGHVISVAPLPYVPKNRGLDSGVKNYVAKIRLHSTPSGVLPGMTAEVEIQAGQAEQALVVPAGSVVAQDGRDFCYVAGNQGLERREVILGQSTSEMLEIRDGLEEGDEIIEDPSTIDAETLSLATVTDLPLPTEADEDDQAPVTE